MATEAQVRPSALNDFAANADLRESLRAPFAEALVSKLPASNGRPALDYVGHAAVTDRLNKVAPDWSISEPRFVTVNGVWVKPDSRKHETFEPYNDGIQHVVGVVCSMTIGGITRWEVGDCDRPSQPGEEMKKAMSDFIRRAAMRFGVAIDLWAKEDLLSSAVEATVEPRRSDRGPDPSPLRPPSESADRPSVLPSSSDEAAQGGLATSDAAPSDAGAALGADDRIGEGAPSSSTGAAPATSEQFDRLLTGCGDNPTRALIRLNRTAADMGLPKYATWALARMEATSELVDAAISGGAPAS